MWQVHVRLYGRYFVWYAQASVCIEVSRVPWVILKFTLGIHRREYVVIAVHP